MRPIQVRFVVVAGILTCSVPAALASPAMIRLGYPTCSGCHLSPQGRGLLTDYGKGIDEAESARAGDGELTHERRRVMHDVRLLAQIETDPIANRGAGSTSTTGGEWLPLARLWYRNATFLGERQRVSAIDLHWHDLRHEGACRLLGDGVDIRVVQLILGHSDIKTTQRYLNITDEELRKALTGVWERRRQLTAVRLNPDPTSDVSADAQAVGH